MPKQAVYKEIGLVNTREMFEKAMEKVTPSRPTTSTTWSSSRPSSLGCVESDSPFILQVSRGRAQVRQPDPAALPGPGRRRA